MRYVRWLVVVLFVASLGIWGYARYLVWNYTDTHAPVIEVEPEVLSISVDEVEERLLEGVLAWDEEQGDLTDQIIVGELAGLTQQGNCHVTYVVFDAANNSTSYQREIQFTDYRPPYFELTSPLVFSSEESVTPMAYIRAYDVLDGDITDEMVQKLSQQEDSERIYHVEVQVSNRLGDFAELELPVHVLEPGEGKLENRMPLVYVSMGSDWSAEACVEAVTAEAQEEIQVESHVDVQTPGVYEIHFQAGKMHTWTTVVVY